MAQPMGEILTNWGYKVLLAHKGNTWLANWRDGSVHRSVCGYVGVNDGWTDLADNYRLDWQYQEALDGNIALTGGLDLSNGTELRLASLRYNSARCAEYSRSVVKHSIRTNT